MYKSLRVKKSNTLYDIERNLPEDKIHITLNTEWLIVMNDVLWNQGKKRVVDNVILFTLQVQKLPMEYSNPKS